MALPKEIVPSVCDAIVIGAGAAGIASARELLARGFRKVIVLEARDRVGGRAHTSDELGSGVPLDHGGQWIHGYSESHPMVRLASEVDVHISTKSFGNGISVHSDGRPVEQNNQEEARHAFNKLEDCMTRPASYGSVDCS